MRNFLYFLFLGFILQINTSCKKPLNNVNDYFPVVKTVSVTTQADGTVLIKGEIISNGAAEIELIGFCCSSQNDPNMASRQIIVSPDGKEFSAVYAGFDIDSVYYFRAWATNHYGYAYGNTVSLNGIIAMDVTPPCNNVMNSVNIGGGNPTASYSTISTPSNNMGIWEFTAQTSSGPTVNFTFGSGLTTGIYTTTSNNSPNPGEVFISFYNGFISGSLAGGSSVYVNTIGVKTYDISICSAAWQYSSSTYYFNTRLTVQ